MYNKNIASTLNNFFVDIPKQIDSNMVKTHKKYQYYLCNPTVTTFHFDPTNTEEVNSYIKTLKNNKSTGPSSKPNKLFKQFKNLLVNLQHF